MNRDEKRERLVEYLYGEIPPIEKPAFRQEVESDPELSEELKSFIQLREIYHEHLPNEKAPRHLTKKILNDLGIRRPWYEFFTQGFIRPALAGALMLALTLGVTYQVNQWRNPGATIANSGRFDRGMVAVLDNQAIVSTNSAMSEQLLGNRTVIPQLRVPVRRSFPGAIASRPGSPVSLVGLGSTMRLAPQRVSPAEELYQLNVQADHAVAQFIHQQALRMRAVGDFKGAAQHLSNLIKNYPFYPLKIQVMAQRVDCLFKSGDMGLANRELKVLRELSPSLAYLLERRQNN